MAAVAVVACLTIVSRGLNFGGRFVGGALVTFHGTGDITTEQMREAADDAYSRPDAIIQTTETGGELASSCAPPPPQPRTPRPTPTRWPDPWHDLERLRGHHQRRLKRGVISSLIAFLVSILPRSSSTSPSASSTRWASWPSSRCSGLILVVRHLRAGGPGSEPGYHRRLLAILGYSLYDTVVRIPSHQRQHEGRGHRCTFMTASNLHRPVFHPHHQHDAHLVHPGVRHSLVRRRDAEGLRASPWPISLVAGSSSIAIQPPPALLYVEDPQAGFAELEEYGTEVRPVQVRSLLTGIAPGAAEARWGQRPRRGRSRAEGSRRGARRRSGGSSHKPKPVNNKKRSCRKGRNGSSPGSGPTGIAAQSADSPLAQRNSPLGCFVRYGSPPW